MPPVFAGSLELRKLPFQGPGRRIRRAAIYLPPGYHDEARRYPVLYLHDGQNLFDPSSAFLGHDWGLGQAADELIENGCIEPLIIVGIYNSGRSRIAEYTPVPGAQRRGGRAEAYGRFIAEELKPFIDNQYRTQPQREHTGLGGSSLGGLVTLHLGLKYPQTFSKLAVMSPSVWWANRAILDEVRALPRKLDAKIWLDIGACEGSKPQSSVDDVIALRDALIQKGWRLGSDLAFLCEPGAEHNEAAWGRRMRHALPFLYPAGPVPVTPLPVA